MINLCFWALTNIPFYMELRAMMFQ
jgi:hypothetical protein